MLQHQENNTEEQVYAIFAPESNRARNRASGPRCLLRQAVLWTRQITALNRAAEV